MKILLSETALILQIDKQIYRRSKIGDSITWGFKQNAGFKPVTSEDHLRDLENNYQNWINSQILEEIQP